MFRIVSASLSDIGKVREINEDAVVEAGSLFAVADGMGGHQAGEVASSLALSVIEQYIEDNLGVLSRREARREGPRGGKRERLPEGVLECAVPLHGDDRHAPVQGGGTAYIGHVGDSRAYLYRDGVLKRLTRDHSLVARLVEEGEITEEESRRPSPAEHHTSCPGARAPGRGGRRSRSRYSRETSSCSRPTGLPARWMT